MTHTHTHTHTHTPIEIKKWMNSDRIREMTKARLICLVCKKPLIFYRSGIGCFDGHRMRIADFNITGISYRKLRNAWPDKQSECKADAGTGVVADAN